MAEYLAPAKYNLFLNVLGKLVNGYHLLHSAVVPLSLYDRIQIDIEASSKIEFHCSLTARLRAHVESCGADLVRIAESLNSPSNLAFKAIALFAERITPLPPLRVSIEKDIPFQAGLGGASTDCASVLLALRDIFAPSLTLNELAHLGGELGSDVPAMVYQQLLVMHGTGNRIELPEFKGLLGDDLASFMAMGAVIAKCPISVSTALAYGALGFDPIPDLERSEGALPENNTQTVGLLDKLGIYMPSKSPQMLTSNRGIGSRGGSGSRGLLERLDSSLSNSFEEVVVRAAPELGKVRSVLLEHGARAVQLSGSGGAFVGFTESFGEAEEIASVVAKHYAPHWFVAAAQPLPLGERKSSG